MISENTKSIENSKIREMFNLARQYDNPINLTIGEPDFLVADRVAAAGCKAILDGKTKYSENAGVFSLRQKISDYLNDEIGVRYDPERELTVTTGAMGALYQTLKVILNPGEEVIVNEPCWTNYVQQIKMCGGCPVIAETDAENGFSIDIEEICRHITEKTKAIIINSPCNPTGAVIKKEKLIALSELAKEMNILIISDEVYKHIIFDEIEFTSIASLSDMKERTVVIDSFSKSQAMTGFRIGYAAGPEAIISNITKLQENIAACAAMPSQYAAIAALEGDKNHLNQMVNTYQKRRDFLMEEIDKIPNISCDSPKGAFYAFVNIEQSGMTSEEFAVKLLKEKQVVTVPGTAFGEKGEGYIRISFATSLDVLKDGLDRMQDFIENHLNSPQK